MSAGGALGTASHGSLWNKDILWGTGVFSIQSPEGLEAEGLDSAGRVWRCQREEEAPSRKGQALGRHTHCITAQLYTPNLYNEVLTLLDLM